MIRAARLVALRWPRIRGEVYSWLDALACFIGISIAVLSLAVLIGGMG